MLGHAEALAMVREGAGTGFRCSMWRIAIACLYTCTRSYASSTTCGGGGQRQLQHESCTHDSELTAAVVDSERDTACPDDPAAWGTEPGGFARELRLTMMREHLASTRTMTARPRAGRGDCPKSAAELDAWHDSGRHGPRPAGSCAAIPSARKASFPPAIAGSPHRSTGPSLMR